MVKPQDGSFKNPFRPGAGHMPPYLAGREAEHKEFARLLEQETILENLVLTGLRGLGKTVLLDKFKPLAIKEGWLWVGTDLSEASSISEINLSQRLLTDLSLVTSPLVIRQEVTSGIGFGAKPKVKSDRLTYPLLVSLHNETPGLVADKIKHVLEFAWQHMSRENKQGLIFAYDEAQNLADHKAKDQFPLSLLLDVFQSIQKRGIPFMLVLTGLPTLFPKLVEARTFAERMFRVVFLDKLEDVDSRKAITKPIQETSCPVVFDNKSVETICEESGGYPYFIQFICREVYDVFIQQKSLGQKLRVPLEEIIRKLDTDFFAGRWAKATDRQRDLLRIVALLNKPNGEFTVHDIVKASVMGSVEKPFGNSHASQMLATLSEAGLVYKNRYGKYSLAVPLLDQFILRQMQARDEIPTADRI